MIRDSQGFSDAILIVPPPLVQCLQLFDGESTELDLKAALVKITGELDVSAIQRQFVSTLSQAGFLHDDVYFTLRDERHREFAEAPIREAVHAGGAYPDDEAELRGTLAGYLDGDIQAPHSPSELIGIAAPHVSPFGGIEAYRAAYRALTPEHRERTFVVLGTSHYGQPNRFGLTRKPFATPFGETRTDTALVDRLARLPAAEIEDYCHAVEHSIEFQIVFLQHLYGADIRVVPVLCGPFADSICAGGLPEEDDVVRAFFDELGELAAREGNRLLWVLGIDMAHIGRRYGDPFVARAQEGRMLEIAERDRARIERVNAGDGAGFWDLVQQNQDDLKWCGSSPLYTFLKAVPQARGSVRAYQQWNIDQESVVSFAALAFAGAA
jgi:AmmeMemoRadiSam system protein B